MLSAQIEGADRVARVACCARVAADVGDSPASSISHCAEKLCQSIKRYAMCLGIQPDPAVSSNGLAVRCVKTSRRIEPGTAAIACSAADATARQHTLSGSAGL